MSLFDEPAFSERLFFPRADASEPPAGAIDDFIARPDASLHVRWYAGHDNARTLLLFHGNGEVVADYDDSADHFDRVGLRLAVVDFRGYGQSTGTPTLRTMISDAVAVTAAVREMAGGPIIVMGRSVGSACAAEIYARALPSVAGVVIESGSADLAALVRRRGMTPPPAFTAEDLAAFDPVGKLRRGSQPLLVLHGADDTMIGAHEAQITHDAAGTRDKQLVLVPQRGHNDLSISPIYWDALRMFASSLA